MFNRFSVIIVIGLLALVGCSSPVEQAPVSDAGPTWLDSSPAVLYPAPRNDVRPIPRFEVPDAAEYHSPCSSYDACGGSWKGFVCPADYQPRPEANCMRDLPDCSADAGVDSSAACEQTQPIFCCYGSSQP